MFQVSVVIPAYNESGNIGTLIEEVFRALPDERLGELIVVDDASRDGTAAEAAALGARFPRLRVLSHARNAGQSTSLRTGILAARFPVIATLDGDGQNDPADLPALIAALAPPGSATGPALVGGVRVTRRDTGSKRWASRAANRIRDAVLRDECPDTGCGIKVFWREAFLLLPFFTSIHRYLPALFQTYGLRTAYLPVNDRPRLHGVSKYNNLHRALIGLSDLAGVSWLRRRTRHTTAREL